MDDTTPEERIRNNELVGKLRGMGLNTADFVIFGSAPLLAHGLRNRVSDLDVVARREVWDYVSQNGCEGRGTRSGDPIWLFHCGKIQFSRNWIRFPEHCWDVDDLIDNADIIDGLRFAKVDDVLTYKTLLDRPKDQVDLANLRRHIEKRDAKVTCGI
jgi:hypothetical protein